LARRPPVALQAGRPAVPNTGLRNRKADRQTKSSDGTDIDALSAYAPYMDVVCTHAFMADQLRGITEEYGITLFHAKTSSLRKLKAFLESYVSGVSPIRRPSITAFVLPPKERRDESFQFSINSALRCGQWG
jgi:hypothetical protein